MIQNDGVLPLIVEALFGLKGQSFCEALTLRRVASTASHRHPGGKGANAFSSGMDGKRQRPMVVVKNET